MQRHGPGDAWRAHCRAIGTVTQSATPTHRQDNRWLRPLAVLVIVAGIVLVAALSIWVYSVVNRLTFGDPDTIIWVQNQSADPVSVRFSGDDRGAFVVAPGQVGMAVGGTGRTAWQGSVQVLDADCGVIADQAVSVGEGWHGFVISSAGAVQLREDSAPPPGDGFLDQLPTDPPSGCP
jgi:hypothetical protein